MNMHELRTEFTKYVQPSQMADERIEVMANSCPKDGKLSFKADGRTDQRHIDVERKLKYYHIIFPERT